VSKGTCELDGCDATVYTKSLCRSHYQKQWRANFATNQKLPRRSPEERSLAKVDGSDPLGCWTWTAGGDALRVTGASPLAEVFQAYRWAYEFLIAEVPPGLVLDHLCRNRLCVRCLGALEVVTRGENVRRGNAPAHIVSRTKRLRSGLAQHG